MRWTIFALFTIVCGVLQLGLAPLWRVDPLGTSSITPSLLMILGIFIAVGAPRVTGLWAMLILGTLMDIFEPIAVAGGDSFALLGPNALGYLVGALIAMELRGLIFRDSPIAFVIMVFVCGLFINLVGVALLKARGLPWHPGDAVLHLETADELIRRFLQLVYTCVLALPMGTILIGLNRWWAFDASAGQAGARRFPKRTV